ncbi:hypothetical protein, conserved [Eimeria necatrix]|uniref:Uncharacterized protein n=1 Tax=Eimeria necatrix TaxID=51315 RepID=U6MWR7_9EIME|nr:hypothetical protein, conserved [Eimeria necatrix]CDJ66145.1 hypothetical protein, conserved [Eimeria necatrix]
MRRFFGIFRRRRSAKAVDKGGNQQQKELEHPQQQHAQQTADLLCQAAQQNQEQQEQEAQQMSYQQKHLAEQRSPAAGCASFESNSGSRDTNSSSNCTSCSSRIHASSFVCTQPSRKAMVSFFLEAAAAKAAATDVSSEAPSAEAAPAAPPSATAAAPSATAAAAAAAATGAELGPFREGSKTDDEATVQRPLGGLPFVCGRSRPRALTPTTAAAEAAAAAAAEAKRREAEGCWDVEGYPAEAAAEGALYSATLAAASLDVFSLPFNHAEKCIISSLKLPELGSRAIDYPVPPALLLEEALKQQEDPDDVAAAAAAMLQQQPQPLPRSRFMKSPRRCSSANSSSARRALEALDESSVFCLPLAHRRRLLFNMLANFCLEANAGLSLFQLTASRDTLPVFLRLSDDLQQLLLDARTGHILEFPLANAEAVYTLQRRRVPIDSARTEQQQQVHVHVQQQQLPPQQQQLPPLDMNMVHATRSSSGGYAAEPVEGGRRRVLLQQQQTQPQQQHEDADEGQAASVGFGGRSSTETTRNFIVVVEFGCTKLAFAFEDRINAETFQLATGLLARRAKEIQQQSSFSAIVSFAENLPFTPRAAKEFLHQLAAPSSSNRPLSSRSSSSRIQDIWQQQPQQLQPRHSQLGFIETEETSSLCGCWGPLKPVDTTPGPLPTLPLFGIGPPLPSIGRGRGPPW